MATFEELNSVFRTVFDDDSIQVRPETTAADIDGWDSLSHVNLIVSVEQRFKVRFTQKELLTLKNVGDLFQAIQTKVP